MTEDTPLEAGQTIPGTISEVRAFGALVDILHPLFTALLPISEIPGAADPSAAYRLMNVGDRKIFKILGVNDRRRITLSLIGVEQPDQVSD